MRNQLFSLAGAILVVLAAIQSIGSFGSTSPTIFTPPPMPFVFVEFAGFPVLLIPPLAGLVFLLWDPRALLRGFEPRRFPRRTWLLLATLLITSAVWYVWIGRAAVQYGIAPVFYAWVAINAVLALLSITLASIAQRTNRPLHRWMTHVLLFVWGLLYAFPWLGDTL
ncbi:MAG: hypothetical protein JOZ54_11045 [Acidobacteria bacterium]|nr:hypothetical protein [Acidobacteriota bacterium]